MVGAKRFQNANILGALDNRGVHGEKNDQQPDRDGQQDHGVDKGL